MPSHEFLFPVERPLPEDTRRSDNRPHLCIHIRTSVSDLIPIPFLIRSSYSLYYLKTVRLDHCPLPTLMCFESSSRTPRGPYAPFKVRVHMVVERCVVRVLLLLADGADGHTE
jgi:hypothetical protein